MRFAHGERLAGQYTVKDHAAEQVVLGDVRQDNAHIARLCAERLDHIRAVDIVDLGAAVRLQIGVQTGLHGRHRDGPLGGLDHIYTGLVRRAERIAVRAGVRGRRVRHIGLAAVLRIEGGQTVQQFIGRHAEHHAVDRLDDQAVVVDVDHLDQRKARGMVGLLVRRQALFDLFPIRLGGRHRVIAVAHRVGEQRLRIRAAVFFVEGFAVAQRLQTGLDLVGLRALRDKPAVDVAAALHQVGVIHLFKAVGFVKQRLDDPAVRVVDQDHDMRQLHARALPHLEPRRDTLDHGFFGRADERSRAGGVLIGLQIDREHDTAARAGAARPALGQDDARGQGAQRAVRDVTAHGLVDARGAVGDVVVLQIDLGQGQAQGRGRVPDDAVRLGPVFGLRGILVAGDDRPFGEVAAVLRQHDIRNMGAAICHDFSSS